MAKILLLISTYLIFILFSLIISLFGGIFIYIFQKRNKKRWNLTLLEYSFISYAVGILLYILISYILSFFKLFNFYTAYLPFLIISIIFLLYLFKKRKIQQTLINVKQYLSSNYRSVILYILILFIVYIFQFIALWPTLSRNSALLARDSYYWTKQVLYLNENGIINYSEHGSIYPWGFIFFCGGNLLISNNFTTTYYFMKFACFPFLNLYILVMFSISKRIFKKNTLIFFCLLSILAQMFFIYRIIMFLSSSMAVLLILISLLIIITEAPNYLLCVIISASFLFNPVYSFYFIMVVLIFYFIKLIISNRQRILIYKEMLILGIFSIIFVIPYIVSVVLFYNTDFISLVETFSRFFEIDNFIGYGNLNSIPSNSGTELFLLSLFNFNLGDFGFDLYIILIFILPILSFFLKNDNQTGCYKEFSIFIKVGFLTMIFVLFSPFILNYVRFFDIFYIRILEAFIPFLIILSGVFFNYVITRSNKLWHDIKLKNRKVKTWAEKSEFNKKVLNLPFVLIILILLSSFFTYNYSREKIGTKYYYDNSMVDCVFYINANIQKGSNIAVYDFNESSIHSSAIYYLLFNYDLTFYQFDSNITLNEFWDFLQANSIKELIINLSYYNQGFIDSFSSNSSFTKLLGGLTNGDFALYEIL